MSTQSNTRSAFTHSATPKTTTKRRNIILFAALLMMSPFFTACGLPEFGGLDSMHSYYRNMATSSSQATQHTPNGTTQGRSDKSVDIPVAKEGCEGFYARATSTQKPQGQILAVAGYRGNNMNITPLQLTSPDHLRVGNTQSVSYNPEQGHDSVQATLDGHELHTTQNQGSQVVVRRQPLFMDAEEATEHTLSKTQAASVQAHRGYSYIVHKNKVVAIDMLQSHKPSCNFKAPKADLADEGLTVHKVVRSGSTLYGLHDSSYIKYVYVYKLQANGLGYQSFGAALPSRPNLKYHNMSVQQGILAVYGTYSYEGKTGHLVATFQVQSKGLMPLGEHDVKPTRAASDFGVWQGMTVYRKHVLAASERGGVQVMDKDLRTDTRKEFFVGGKVTDLQTAGSYAYAIVHQENGTFLKVLDLETRSNKLNVVGSHQLPGNPTHFVR